MKKIKYIVLGLLGTFLLQACSEDKMDEINKNVNYPEDVESKFILTDVMVASAFSVTGADLSFYAGVYTELSAGVEGQMNKAFKRAGEPQLASTYNNSWGSIYAQLLASKIVIEKCSEGGKEAGNYQALGIAQILYAYNTAVLTDLFGDAPLSESLQPGVVYNAKLDKQEDLYKEIFAKLNDGIANLGKQSVYPSIGKQDVLYQGDNSEWIAVANGLLARYTMRLSLRKPDYQAVIDYVDKSFTAASSEFALKHASVYNPYWLFDNDRGDLAASKSFYELMVSNGPEDARTESFFVGNNFFDNSDVNSTNERYVYAYSGMMSASNPVYMLGYHELLFLKAEAQARLGQDSDALETLKLAVEAAYLKQQTIRFTAAQAKDYTDTFGALTGKPLLKKIMNEKYISFYENEAVEAYNDIRRLKAMGDGDLIRLVHPKPAEFPLRFTYGGSDVRSNPSVKEAFGDGSYVYRENVWWAGGTR